MIDLYTARTPNGFKVSVTLEELGMPYNYQSIDLSSLEQKQDWYLKINPNGRIPAIIDRDNNDFVVFESGAIMIYLAEKAGKLLPTESKARSRVMQWLMFQMGGVGPMFGQLGFFHKFAGKDIEDPRPKDKYVAETARLLKVLDAQLEGQDWIVGDYSIADIAIAPWLRTVLVFYEAAHLVGWDDLKTVPTYLERFLERPAVQRGLVNPPRD